MTPRVPGVLDLRCAGRRVSSVSLPIGRECQLYNYPQFSRRSRIFYILPSMPGVRSSLAPLSLTPRCARNLQDDFRCVGSALATCS